jgi:hypothetical protein
MMTLKHTFYGAIALLLLSLLVMPIQAQEGDLLTRINNLRTSQGLAPYSRNGQLDAAAASHARWMVDNAEVSHSGANGSTPRSRAQAAGYGSQWVSENIYGGSNASVNTAWTFWINSPIHYRGLTSPNYQEVGIGVARGSWGGAYVLLFGGDGGGYVAPVRAASSSGGGGNSAPPPPPSFVVGVDAVGNIMHEIQPGDTLGDIALIYGYTWDDVPYMLEINDLSEEESRTLEIGAVMLVPPYEGTYTPTPGEPTEIPTHTPTPTERPSDTPTATATITPTPTSTATPLPIGTSSAPVNVLELFTATPTIAITPTQPVSPTPQAVAAGIDIENEPPTPAHQITAASEGRPLWLIGAIGLQVVILVGAGVEMVRRHRR